MSNQSEPELVTAGFGGAAPVPHKLSGQLGVASIVFMVVAAAAPLTVIAGVLPIGVAAGNGPAFPVTFIIAAVILLLFSVGFTKMSSYMEEAGAFYTYIRAGLGRRMGFGAAFLALASYVAVMLGVFAYFGFAMQTLLTGWGITTTGPWWIYSFVAVAGAGFLGYRDIDLSGKVLGVLLVCEVGIVVILDLVIIGRGGGPSGLSTALVQPAQIVSGSLGLAMMFAIASFLGFESTAVYRDEAKNPAHTIPRATYVSLLLVGGFYALSSWAIISGWGDKQIMEYLGADDGANVGNLLFDTSQKYLGSLGTQIINVLLVTSVFAAILSFHNVSARYVFRLGQSATLPGKVGTSHEHHGSPHMASLCLTALAAIAMVAFILLRWDPATQVFPWFVGIATLGYIILMSLTCVAMVIFYQRTRTSSNAFVTTVAPVLALIGLVICLVLTVKNFSLLTGADGTLALILQGILVVAFLIGVVMAGRAVDSSAKAAA